MMRPFRPSRWMLAEIRVEAQSYTTLESSLDRRCQAHSYTMTDSQERRSLSRPRVQANCSLQSRFYTMTRSATAWRRGQMRRFRNGAPGPDHCLFRTCNSTKWLPEPEYIMTLQTVNAISRDSVVMKRLAKYLVQHCFRNTFLEDLHAGITPDSKTGDYTDVLVRSPYGEIPWPQLSLLSDEENEGAHDRCCEQDVPGAQAPFQ